MRSITLCPNDFLLVRQQSNWISLITFSAENTAGNIVLGIYAFRNKLRTIKSAAELNNIFLTSAIGVLERYTIAYSKNFKSPKHIDLTTKLEVNLLEA